MDNNTLYYPLDYSIEMLYHFRCQECEKWWSVGDAPVGDKMTWTCPWCGAKHLDEELDDSDESNDENSLVPAMAAEIAKLRTQINDATNCLVCAAIADPFEVFQNTLTILNDE